MIGKFCVVRFHPNCYIWQRLLSQNVRIWAGSQHPVGGIAVSLKPMKRAGQVLLRGLEELTKDLLGQTVWGCVWVCALGAGPREDWC